MKTSASQSESYLNLEMEIYVRVYCISALILNFPGLVEKPGS